MATKYFDVRRIMENYPETFLYGCIGRRGAGKTTSPLLRGLDRFVEERKRLLYVRRWTTELSTDALNLLYSSIEDRFQQQYLDAFHDAKILREDEYKWFIQAQAKRHFLYAVNESDRVRKVDQITSCVNVSSAVHAKGPSYDQYDTILFDEIVSDSGYVKPSKPGETEVDLFVKIIQSVSRAHNKTLKVFMTANPDYDIDSCPYLYPFHINYEAMEPWRPYLYDGSYGASRMVKNNICLVKVAMREDDSEDDYLLAESMALFGSAEERMGETGEVKEIKYARISPDIADQAAGTVYCEIVIECPVVRAGIWHAKIYAYPCEVYGEPALLIMGHHWERAEKLRLGTLFCRYDMADIRPVKGARMTYRLNVPPLEEFAELHRHLAAVDANHFIFSDTNRNGTLYQVIRDS